VHVEANVFFVRVALVHQVHGMFRSHNDPRLASVGVDAIDKSRHRSPRKMGCGSEVENPPEFLP